MIVYIGINLNGMVNMLEKDERVDKTQTARRSRKRRRLDALKYLYVLVFILLIITALYVYKANTYNSRFFPNTILNSIDISEKTVSEVENLINSKSSDYILHLKTRDGEENISGQEVGLRIDAKQEIENLLKQQNIYTWIKQLSNRNEFNVNTLVVLDDASFENRILKIKALDSKNFKEPVSAKISDYILGKGYVVVPETKGTTLDIDKAKSGIKEAFLNLLYEYDFEKEGLYKEPQIKSDDKNLLASFDKLNTYVKASISYSKLPVLTGDTISEWISYDGDENISLDDSKISDYVKEIANAYNTINKARQFKTSYNGATVSVPAGNYGWKISEAKEKEAIKTAIENGENITREPEFEKKAASLTGDDYGNSYVEVNLSAQHLILYKDGKKVLESDFVSGNLAKNWGTPAGIFGLTYKQKDATLKGQDYATPVSYWMPFNRNIGFHDASWRSKFGGDIYKTSGSHGCINMPPENAKILFENISTGFPVICYNLEGSAKKTNTTNTGTTNNNTQKQSTKTQTQAQSEAINSTTAANVETTKDTQKATTKGPDNPTETTKGPSVPTNPTKGPGASMQEPEMVPVKP